MIEDVIAQSHLVVDTLSFEDGTSALSALRAISECQSPAGPFSKVLGINFREANNGRSKATLEVKKHLLNPHGIAHGGVTFSLADSTCGAAALTAIGEPRMVTQDMQIRYHGPAKPGIITAEAKVIHHGQRTITVQCLVTQEDLLIASATGTFAILSPAEVDAIRSR